MDGKKGDTTECLGRIIIVAMFGVYSYQYFYGQRRTRMFFLWKEDNANIFADYDRKIKNGW